MKYQFIQKMIPEIKILTIDDLFIYENFGPVRAAMRKAAAIITDERGITCMPLPSAAN